MQDFGYAGIQANFTQGYKFFLQRRACNTFCSTAYQVWYSGIDAAGKMMDSSQSIPGVLLGRMFRSLKEFQFTFGLSSELLKSLSAFELV